MGMTDHPDIFTHVHQGIRRALFDASTALARASGDSEAERMALALVDDALLFVSRHGENEDALLLPLLEARAPDVATFMRDAHHRIDRELQSIRELRQSGAPGLYLRFSLFIARYLQHMAEEELELEPRIRAVISDAELTINGKEAVARIDPAERLVMLRLLLPALPLAAAKLMLDRMPESLAEQLAVVDDRFRIGGG